METDGKPFVLVQARLKTWIEVMVMRMDLKEFGNYLGWRIRFRMKGKEKSRGIPGAWGLAQCCKHKIMSLFPSTKNFKKEWFLDLECEWGASRWGNLLLCIGKNRGHFIFLGFIVTTACFEFARANMKSEVLSRDSKRKFQMAVNL